MSTPSDSEVFLKKRLVALRKQAGLTQSAVAELATISYDYYKDIEQGVRPNVSLRWIDRLAKVYGITVQEMFSAQLPKMKAKLKSIDSPHYKKRKPKSER